MHKNSVWTRLLLAILVASFFMSFAAVALAEPVTKLAELRIAVQMFEQHPRIFVSATLSEDTQLPAQVPIALPANTRIDWAGEIAGGDIADDPETSFELLETRDGWDIYLVDVESHRTLQVEASMTEPYLFTEGANFGTADFSYVPATDADVFMLAAETPSTVTNFDQSTGYEVFAQGVGGGMLIGPTHADAKAGETFEVNFGFETAPATEGAIDNSSAGPRTDSTTAVIIVLALALLALIGFFLMVWNRENATKVETEELAQRAPASTKRDVGQRGSAKQQSGTKKPFKWNSPQALIVLLIVLAGIALLVWTSQRNASTITENNGVFSQVFATGDPCESLEFELTEAAMQDPEATARALFDVIRTSDLYLLEASLDSNTGTFVVQFCESNVDQASVAMLIENTGLVSGSSLRTLNTPIILDDGRLVVYLSQNLPCVVNTFTIVDPPTDSVAFVQELASAVRQVPTITAVGYDPANAQATFGFCEEQANDDTIADALEKAGIDATLFSEMTETITDSGLDN